MKKLSNLYFILGKGQPIANYLGALRNRLADSHGQGKMPIKPNPRHAELAINLAETMASYLILTRQAQN